MESTRAGVAQRRASTAGLLAALLAGCALQSYAPAPLEQAAHPLPGSLQDQRISAALARAGLSPEPLAGQSATLQLSRLVTAALAVNPALAPARARIAVAEGGIITAGALPNPVLDLPLERHSRIDDEDSNRVGGGIGLSWLVQARGTRPAAVAAARAEREAAAFDLREAAWQVRQAVRAAWATLTFARARSALLAEGGEVADAQVELIRERVGAGQAGAFELGQARLAAQRFSLRAAEQRVAEVTARADLAAAMGVRVTALDNLSAPMLPALPGTLPAAAELQREALTGRNDILAALARYAAAEAQLELQVARQMPDINLSPSWFYEQGDNIWQLAAGLPLPVLNRNEGPIAEARAGRALRAAQFQALQAGVTTGLQTALARWSAVREALDLAHALLARARENVSLSEQQAAAGYADHLQLLQARQERVSADLAVLDLRETLYGVLGDVEHAVRRPLDGSVYARVTDIDDES